MWGSALADVVAGTPPAASTRTPCRSRRATALLDTLLLPMANCIRCGRQLPPILFGKKICQWCVQHEAAQRGELDEDAKQPVIAAPWVRRESSITVTQVILGANVMVFIAMVIASGPSLDFTGKVMVHFGANFGPFTLPGSGGGCSPTCSCMAASCTSHSTCGACGIWVRYANLFTDAGLSSRFI